MKTIVVSAVNIRKGGTLTILKQCLAHLSSLVQSQDEACPQEERLHVTALVHRRQLCDYPGIEYIEMPWCIRSWGLRLWAEYVTMHRISKDIARRQGGRKVWLWLSMHDTTPRVEAQHREVYCHTSFPFLKLQWRDWVMNPKIPLFCLLGRLVYRINAGRNDSIIVQQNWFADAMSGLLGVPRGKFRVIPPVTDVQAPSPQAGAQPSFRQDVPVFFFASTADCHKNFETLCMAAAGLEAEGKKFRVVLTVKGDENRYAKWLFKHWGQVKSIDFHGFMSKDELYGTYRNADCFVFPSRIETWGLPISEYMHHNPSGRLLLADLPYARETSSGRGDFFPATDVAALKEMMEDIINRYYEKRY